jgi:hypothetical protein
MNSNWKGSSQTNSIFTWHDLISKSPEKLHQKIPRHQKHFQQSSRIKNQYTKIDSLSIHKKWTVWEGNQANNTICNSFKIIKIPKNKFNKGYDWTVE